MLLVDATETEKPSEDDSALAPLLSLELVLSEWSQEDSVGTNACKTRGRSRYLGMALLCGLNSV